MLNPSGLRKNLSKFSLRNGKDGALVIEQNCAGTGCALVES